MLMEPYRINRKYLNDGFIIREDEFGDEHAFIVCYHDPDTEDNQTFVSGDEETPSPKGWYFQEYVENQIYFNHHGEPLRELVPFSGWYGPYGSEPEATNAVTHDEHMIEDRYKDI